MNDGKRLTRVSSTLLSEGKMTIAAVNDSALSNHGMCRWRENGGRQTDHKL